MHREVSLYIRHHASDCRVEEAIRAAGEDAVDKDAELAVTPGHNVNVLWLMEIAIERGVIRDREKH